MDDKEMSVHAKRLFVAQSKAAHERNKRKCICEEHSQKVRVETASLGVKNIDLSRHGVIHLSSCTHSDMRRTCWVEPTRKSGRVRASVTIEEEG
jgi:hypothetical protein